MDDLIFTLNVILPILIPVILGFILGKLKFFDGSFLKQANKLVFKILIPISLFNSLYSKDLKSIDWSLALFSAVSIIALFFIGMICVVLFVPEKKQKGVIHQASFRSNYAIIGIPLATLLGGAAAEMQAAVIAAVSVPLFNILAVIALTIYDSEEGNKVSIKDILLKIVKNPLILGVFAGILFMLFRMLLESTIDGGNFVMNIDPDTQFLPKSIKQLAACATPIALIVLGGNFKFSAVKKYRIQLIFSVTLRLIITPVIFLTIAYFMGFKDLISFSILIALFATPIAVSSVPMAQQMGQDDELAGQIVVWTSALSAISLFLIIITCRMINIF